MTEAQMKQFHVRLLEATALIENTTLAYDDVHQHLMTARTTEKKLDHLATIRFQRLNTARELLLKLIDAREFSDDGLPAAVSLEEWQKQMNPEES